MPVALLSVLIVATALRQWRCAVVSLVLLMNWTINTLFVQLSGDNYPWLVFATVDYCAAMILVPITRSWQRIVPVSYALELLMHVAYGVSNQELHEQYYCWWSLNYTAWGQICFVALWIGHDGIIGASDCFWSVSDNSLVSKGSRK